MKTLRLSKISGCILLAVFLLSSCVSRKQIAYFQNIEKLQKRSVNQAGNNIKIKPDDKLSIRVTAPEPDAAIPFNITKPMSSLSGTAGSNAESETYLVSNEGTIGFPVIGTIKVAGHTNIELANKIIKLISEDVQYIKDPIVNVRILNFQITVLGEVNNPGTFSIEDDHISLPKALGLAGDLTIYGLRENVIIISEDDGEKSYNYVDLTDVESLNSPQSYLRQDDIVYVEPKGTRRQSASSIGIAGAYLSIVSVIMTTVILLTK
jgi:polysaccharide export outer membrane protein